jgi:hypothetical protein
MSETHRPSDKQPVREEHNVHAGQGAILLDIGGDVGALVVTVPAALDGHEIEIRPIDRPAPEHLAHVAVIARRTPNGIQHSAVFAELTAGSYELYRRPDGPVALSVTVIGGEVGHARWPIPDGPAAAARTATP